MSVSTVEIGQLSAPNLVAEAANGVRYTYRRFGTPRPGTKPLLFLMHYRGNLDFWDPALVDAVAVEREVILFDNAGVGGSTGTTPRSITEMARHVLAFTEALELDTIDLFGFSMGGFVAQEVALLRPHLIRRLVLAGTGPQGGEGMHGYADPAIHAAATRPEQDGNDVIELFFEKTPTSVAKGWEALQRIFSRTENHDEPISVACRTAQLDAIIEWGIPNATLLNRLAGIKQPTLVAGGDNDRMVPTKNTYLLGEHIPHARVSVYANAGHAFISQYPTEFAAEVNAFLG
ncbi:alpha/beta hydrolase [Streptomyces sulfonofaciens]|uniref:Alpha/beta hydrolase n=1 Tax=Streptomyces sulfonofaciens TaxID=68272 RepID=A0A919GDH9_9ACTN|nr:alpha/beta hydrolase [Streptomyces sulfonofaciens]GHH82792.1 alpha/beta hydrolase [Streptomyces sulfonofaciens]